MNKFYSLLFSLAFTASALWAQPQYQSCLNFDGINDDVVVPAASTFISGSSEISMSAWVYARNASPAYPDFDGFLGFRNDFDADFYLLQLSASTLESRIRTSAGVVTLATANAISLNNWQHYVLTYDGSMLRLYINGQPADSSAASGTITSSVNFNIGNLPFTSADFRTDGKLDDIGLWNRKLTQEEISCIYTTQISTSSPGLQLYFNLNDGIPSGNNSSVSVVIDKTGHMNGTINGMTLSGTSSNFDNGIDHFIYNSTASMCTGESMVFGSQNVSGAGIFYEAFPVPGQCDSLVKLTITSLGPDTAVTQNGNDLIAAVNDTYQWIDCSTGLPIPGETSQTFTGVGNGNYAVILSQGACVDTTICHTILVVSNHEQSASQQFSVNQTCDFIRVNFPAGFTGATIQVIDIQGKLLFESKALGINTEVINCNQWPAGVYLINLYNEQQKLSQKINLLK